MEQSCSWEANNLSANQEFLCFFCNPEVHYRVHKSPPLVPILGQMNPIHNFTVYCLKINSSIIFTSTPTSFEWSLPFRYSNQKSVFLFHVSHVRYMARPSRSACYVGLCHHGMQHPRVVDGGDNLQIWRVVANILNKQSRTAENEWFSSLGFGRGATNPSP